MLLTHSLLCLYFYLRLPQPKCKTLQLALNFLSSTWADSSGLLDGIPSTQHVDCTTQLDASNLAERALNSAVCDTEKDVKQHWFQYQLLRNATHHWSPHLAIDPIIHNSQAYEYIFKTEVSS